MITALLLSGKWFGCKRKERRGEERREERREERPLSLLRDPLYLRVKNSLPPFGREFVGCLLLCVSQDLGR
jgi:hypothetical protein